MCVILLKLIWLKLFCAENNTHCSHRFWLWVGNISSKTFWHWRISNQCRVMWFVVKGAQVAWFHLSECPLWCAVPRLRLVAQLIGRISVDYECWSPSPPHFAAIVLRSKEYLGTEGQLVMIKISFSIIVENSAAILLWRTSQLVGKWGM